MDSELERRLELYKLGLWTLALGNQVDWDPQPLDDYQKRHSAFWLIVAGMIRDESSEYDDLPDWMTETGATQLEANINN